MNSREYRALIYRLNEVERLAGEIAAQPSIPLDIWSMRKIAKMARAIGEHCRQSHNILAQIGGNTGAW